MLTPVAGAQWPGTRIAVDGTEGCVRSDERIVVCEYEHMACIFLIQERFCVLRIILYYL